MTIEEAKERANKGESKIECDTVNGNKEFSYCVVTIIYDETAKKLYLRYEESITLNQCLEKVHYEYGNDEKDPTVMVIVEYPLHGEIYEFGNYADGKWYEHGTTKGYA